MSFKNIRFNESEVMKSLEKLAVEKGLVKPEEIKKVASVKQEIEVNDFTTSILKLCSELRTSGFSKYADDIEGKFLQLKQAENLYDTMKETAEDLVDAAHPGGSTKLEGIEGDAVVETVFDAKKKIEDLLKKTPKTKLANNDYINMVKITLADDGNKQNEMVAGTVASWGAFSVGNYLFKLFLTKVKQAGVNRFISKELAKVAVEAAKKNLTMDQAKDLVSRVTKEIATKGGESAGQAAEKASVEAVKEAVKKATEKEVTKQVSKTVIENAAKSTIKPPPMIGSAAQGISSGWATVFAGGGGAVLAAATLGAVLGGVAGYLLFDWVQPDKITDAGKNLMHNIDRRISAIPGSEDSFNSFRTKYYEMLKLYPAIDDLIKTKNPEDLFKLKDLFNKINETNRYAAAIWALAQGAKENTHWYSLNEKVLSNIVLDAKNYMEISNALSTNIQKFYIELDREIEKQSIKTTKAPEGAVVSNKVETAYDAQIKEVEQYKTIVNQNKQKIDPKGLVLKDLNEFTLALNTLKVNYINTKDKTDDLSQKYLNKLNRLNGQLQSIYNFINKKKA